MTLPAANIDIFIGHPITERSELACIEHIVSLLQQQNQPAVLLANFEIGDVQIDLVVATEEFVVVIEIKGSQHPLKGRQNGEWKTILPGGNSKSIRNYYEQALRARHAVKNAMVKLNSTLGEFYPASMLLFYPNFPVGSEVTVDTFKVKVNGLNDLTDTKVLGSSRLGNLADWCAFAVHFGLEKVLDIAHVVDKTLQDAAKTTKTYQERFWRTYEVECAGLVPVDCRWNDQPLSSSQFNFSGSQQINLMLVGPMGCAKSMLAKQIGIGLAKASKIPVYLEAGFFSDSLGTLLDSTIKSLCGVRAIHLFDYAEKLQQQIVIILDGLNECNSITRQRIARAIKAFQWRYAGRVILVSQTDFPELNDLNTKILTVLAPSATIKADIASKHCDAPTLAALRPLLDTVESGLEADVIGQIAADNPAVMSVFGRFDHFVRKRVEKTPTAVRALAHLAGTMTERIRFSLTVAEADRVLTAAGYGAETLTRLTEVRLLKQVAGRVSFNHEMFQQVYAAESVIRLAGTDENVVLTALQTPRHARQATLLIGAIDDNTVLQHVLDEISDPRLIAACQLGECGVYARQWADKLFLGVIKKMKEECEQVEFVLTTERYSPVAVNPDTLLSWTLQERAFVGALTELLYDNYYFEPVMDLLVTAGDSLRRNRENLLPAAQARKINLRDHLFSSLYLAFHAMEQAMIAVIVRSMDAGVPFDKENKPTNWRVVEDYLERTSKINFGQLYFLVAFTGYRATVKRLYKYLYNALVKHWDALPYHLKLELLGKIVFYNIPEQDKQVLTELITGRMGENALFNNMLWDALRGLGKLEEDEAGYQEQTKADLQRLLAHPQSPTAEACTEAYGFYLSQFDHPYDFAFYFAVDALPAPDKAAFYRMALKGASSDMFLPSLLGEIARLGNAEDAVELDKWREVPEAISSLVDQDSKIVYAAHISMGLLTCPLTSYTSKYDDERRQAMSAYAELLYWVNRPALSEHEVIESSRSTMQLLQTASGYAVDAIYQSRRSVPEQIRDRVRLAERVFPGAVATICRNALQNPGSLQSIHQFEKPDQIASHAIEMLGDYGNMTDIPLLMTFVDDKKLGSSAIGALKKLEATGY